MVETKTKLKDLTYRLARNNVYTALQLPDVYISNIITFFVDVLTVIHPQRVSKNPNNASSYVFNM